MTKLTTNMVNMLTRIYRLTVAEGHTDYTAVDIHKATRTALISRGLIRVNRHGAVEVTPDGLKAYVAAAAIAPTADEIAERDEQRKLADKILTEDLPASRAEQTLREDVPFPRPTADEVAEMYEQAAAIDEKRTIARAFLSTPTGVVLTWDEIQRGYLDAMAERDRIEHNQAVIGSDKRAAAVDAPRELDTWLTHGMVLVGPQTGDRYRFLRWDGGWAVVRHEADGTEMRIAQADVTLWQYLPKASAEGVAAAKRRVPWRDTFVMHTRTGQRYRVLGMDSIVTGKLIISHDCGAKCSEHERAISPGVLQWDYIACDENGNVQPLPRNSLNRRSAPAYAVGDRVRWSEDRRPMFVRSVTPTGAYVAPTMDGPLAAFAAAEDLSPELYPNSGLDVIVKSLRDTQSALDGLSGAVAALDKALKGTR